MCRIARPHYHKRMRRWFGALGEHGTGNRRRMVFAPATVATEAEALQWFQAEQERRGIAPPLPDVPVNPAVRGKVIMALRLATRPVTSGELSMFGLAYPTGPALYEVLNSLVADGLVKVTTRFDEQRRRTYVMYELRELAPVAR